MNTAAGGNHDRRAPAFAQPHRLGVLPCQLPEGISAQTLGLNGTERFDPVLGGLTRPRQPATLLIERADGRRDSVPLLLRIDTPIEAAYFWPAESCRMCSNSCSRNIRLRKRTDQS